MPTTQLKSSLTKNYLVFPTFWGINIWSSVDGCAAINHWRYSWISVIRWEGHHLWWHAANGKGHSNCASPGTEDLYEWLKKFPKSQDPKICILIVWNATSEPFFWVKKGLWMQTVLESTWLGKTLPPILIRRDVPKMTQVPHPILSLTPPNGRVWKKEPTCHTLPSFSTCISAINPLKDRNRPHEP